jgi:hypothetical protein
VRRWPLHPRPQPWETLDRWVRRLAEAYGVSFEVFCRRALDLDRRAAHDLGRAPSRATLERLSVGTGVPVTTLEGMTLGRVWQRLTAELERALADERIRPYLETLVAPGPSRNS